MTSVVLKLEVKCLVYLPLFVLVSNLHNLETSCLIKS